MSWATVESRIKIYGPDGTPMTVNGIPITSYNTPAAAEFLPGQKNTIIAALEDLYNNSLTAQALLDSGTAGGDIWLVNTRGDERAS